MLRKAFIQGFRVVLARQVHGQASLGIVGACELSRGRLLQAPSAWFPAVSREIRVDATFSSFAAGTPYAPELPLSQLQFWRYQTAAAKAKSTPTTNSKAAATTKSRSGTTRGRLSSSKTKPGPAATKRGTKSPIAPKAKKPTTKRASAIRKKPAKTTRPRKRATTTAERAKAARDKAKERQKARKAKEREKAKKAKERERKKKERERIKARAQRLKERIKAKAKAAKEKAKAKKEARIKRAPTAFNLFVRDAFANAAPVEKAASQGGTSGSNKETLKTLGQRFNELPPEEKRKYEERAAAAKAVTAKLREDKAKAWAARHSLPPFLFYYKEKFPSVRAANPGLPLTDLTKMMAQMWRGLPSEAKQKYIDEVNTDRRAKGLKPLADAKPQAEAKPEVEAKREVEAKPQAEAKPEVEAKPVEPKAEKGTG